MFLAEVGTVLAVRLFLKKKKKLNLAGGEPHAMDISSSVVERLHSTH